MSLQLPPLPEIENMTWFGELLISTLGALIAFYFWNWYHSPFLLATSVEQKEVISPKEDRNSRFNTRLYVKNIGRVPARNCQASLWLMGRNTDAEVYDGTGTKEVLYVISSPVGWANRRGSLFADDHSTFSETETIAPGDTGLAELYRQTHTGQFTNSDWVSEGVSIGEIYTDEISDEVEEQLGSKVLIAGGRGRGDLYAKISGGINQDQLATTEWEEAEIRIVAENSNIIHRELELQYEEGQIKTKLRRPEGIFRRIKINIRQLFP